MNHQSTTSKWKTVGILAVGLPVLVLFLIGFIAVVALSIFTVIYLFIAQPHQVRGAAMLPTYPNKAYVLTDKWTYRSQPPQRGDVIVFASPQNKEMDYIKRIVGTPGDTILIQDGRVHINDSLLFEPYLIPTSAWTIGGMYLPEGKEVAIPEGMYAVFGDNRQHSSDSSAWGFVPKESIVGRVLFCYANCTPNN